MALDLSQIRQEKMKGVLQIHLFGKFAAHLDGRPLPIETRKVQELLAYLVLHRQRPLAREGLAHLLWSDSPGQRARRYLRKALWQLQTALGDAAELLLVDAEWASIEGAGPLWVDCVELEESFVAVRELPGEELSTAQAERLAEAAQAVRGEYMEGCYEDWCLCERELLQHLYLSSLDKLMHCCAAKGCYEEGVAYGHLILRHDRAREHTHRELMCLFYLAGNRTGALQQYEQCVQVLQQELRVAPSAETTGLYEWMVSAAPGRPPTPIPETLPPSTLPALSPDEFQNSLLNLQQAIALVQRYLNRLP